MANATLTYRVLIDTASARSQAASLRAMLEKEMKSIKTSDIKLFDTASLNAAKQAIAQQVQAMQQAANQQKSNDQAVSAQARISASERTALARTEMAERANASRAAMVQMIEEEKRLTATVRAETAERIRAAKGGSGGGGSGGGGIEGMLGGLVKGGAIAVAIGALKELGSVIDDLNRKGAIFNQLTDVLDTYARSVGTTGDKMITAAKAAAQGTIAEYDLVLNANRAIQFQVAQSAEQYAKLIELSTALGRAQGVSDTEALGFLTTGLARESRLILDNLGLIINIKKAKEDYARSVGKTASQLTQAERKQALLNEAYRQGAVAIEANRQAAGSTATAIERFDANIADLTTRVGSLTAELLKVPTNKLADLVGYAADYVDDGKLDLDSRKRQLANAQSELEETKKAIAQGEAELENINPFQRPAHIQVLASLKEYVAELTAEITFLRGEMLTLYAEADGANMGDLALEDFGQKDPLTGAPVTKKLTFDISESANIEALQQEFDDIQSALMTRAKNLIPLLGFEQVTAHMAQAKIDLDAAYEQMQSTGISDPEEISFRVAGIANEMMTMFDQLEARAGLFGDMETNLGGIAVALDQLNVSSVDFLPGMDAARDELISLSEELAHFGYLTEEQAARYKYLTEAAASVSDSTSLLGQVTAELGDTFLASNEYAAALVSEMYNADAAFRSGLISSDVYAGIIATLSGRLLVLAQSAGIATGAIAALNGAQGGRTSSAGLAAGSSVANRVQTEQAKRERDANRREQERYDAEVARQQERYAADVERQQKRLEDAQKRQAKQQEKASASAAKTQEKAAIKAGKELEKGAKKAAQALTSALEAVPGLFNTTQVTEEDKKMSELGIYGDKADEYIRRLRDEVENGVDWADVSIEDAKAGLERVGIKAGESAEAILAQFEAAWNNQSLWADVANIEAFVNAEAVQASLDLQEKSRIGRENILKFFGVVIEEGEDIVEAGLSGGGASMPDIEPIDLSEYEVDPADYYVEPPDVKKQADLISQTFKDSTNELGERASQAVKDAFSKVDKSGFLKNGIDSWLGQASGGTVGANAKPIQITVAADPETKNMLNVLQASRTQPVQADLTGAAAAITPKFDTTTFQAELDKLTGLTAAIEARVTLNRENIAALNTEISTQTPVITATTDIAADAGAKISNALAKQLVGLDDVFKSHGQGIGAQIKEGISSSLNVGPKGEISVDFANFIGNNLTAAATVLRAQGQGIADLLKDGIVAGSEVKTGGDGSQLTPMITGLITGLNAQVRAKKADIMREGESIGGMIQAGAVAFFSGGTVSTGGEEKSATDGMGGAFLAAMSTDFASISNMFYTVGFIPAGSLQSGFKSYEYTGLATSFMDALTLDIRLNAEGLGQRGGTMASYVQSGFVSAFNTETFKAQLMSVGETMYKYIEMGLLSSIKGGKLTDAIATKVVEDLATETEQP